MQNLRCGSNCAGTNKRSNGCDVFFSVVSAKVKVTSKSHISRFLIGVSDSSQLSSITKLYIVLKSAYGKWLSAKDDGLTIQNNQASVGWKEKFEIDFTSDGYVNLKTWKAKFWSAQTNGVLQANRDRAGSWEKFQMFVYGEGIVAL